MPASTAELGVHFGGLTRSGYCGWPYFAACVLSLIGAVAVTCHAAYHSQTATSKKALVPVMHRCVLWLSVSNVAWAMSNLGCV